MNFLNYFKSSTTMSRIVVPCLILGFTFCSCSEKEKENPNPNTNVVLAKGKTISLNATVPSEKSAQTRVSFGVPTFNEEDDIVPLWDNDDFVYVKFIDKEDPSKVFVSSFKVISLDDSKQTAELEGYAPEADGDYSIIAVNPDNGSAAGDPVQFFKEDNQIEYTVGNKVGGSEEEQYFSRGSVMLYSKNATLSLNGENVDIDNLLEFNPLGALLKFNLINPKEENLRLNSVMLKFIGEETPIENDNYITETSQLYKNASVSITPGNISFETSSSTTTESFLLNFSGQPTINKDKSLSAYFSIPPTTGFLPQSESKFELTISSGSSLIIQKDIYIRQLITTSEEENLAVFESGKIYEFDIYLTPNATDPTPTPPFNLTDPKIGDEFSADGFDWVILDKDDAENLLIISKYALAKKAYSSLKLSGGDDYFAKSNITRKFAERFYNGYLNNLKLYSKPVDIKIEKSWFAAGGTVAAPLFNIAITPFEFVLPSVFKDLASALSYDKKIELRGGKIEGLSIVDNNMPVTAFIPSASEVNKYLWYQDVNVRDFRIGDIYGNQVEYWLRSPSASLNDFIVEVVSPLTNIAKTIPVFGNSIADVVQGVISEVDLIGFKATSVDRAGTIRSENLAICVHGVRLCLWVNVSKGKDSRHIDFFDRYIRNLPLEDDGFIRIFGE